MPMTLRAVRRPIFHSSVKDAAVVLSCGVHDRCRHLASVVRHAAFEFRRREPHRGTGRGGLNGLAMIDFIRKLGEKGNRLDAAIAAGRLAAKGPC